MLRLRTTTSARRPRKYLFFSGLLLIVATYVVTTGVNLQFGGCQYIGFRAKSQNNLQDNNTKAVSADGSHQVISDVSSTFATEAPTLNKSVHSAAHNFYLPVTNFTSVDTNLLSNLSSKTTELKEYPGYFENFTYFYLNRSRVSDIPSQYSIPGTSVCSGDVDLLVMIMSVKQHSDWRLLIRQTWASPIYHKSWSQKGLVRLVFFFGNEGFTDVENLALYNESKIYRDIVVAGFKDSYGNLSLKLATALTWASKHCPQTKFVAKVDMDTFVHLQVFLKLIQRVAQNYTDFIIGYQHMLAKPFVVRDGKWAVPHSVYAYSFFPKYVYGHSYVLTGSVVHKMAASFPFVQIVPNEDAFTTGIMAVTLNITRLGNSAFAFSLQQYTFCDLVYRRYVSTMYNVKYMKELWDALLTGNCTETQIT